MLLLGVLAAALAVGLLRRGDLAALGRVRWVAAVLPLVAIAVQVIAFLPEESASPRARLFAASLHLVSYALLLAFAWLNRRVAWMPAVGLGLLLNAAAIAANGGFMPASAVALLGSPHDVAATGVSNNSIVMTPTTPLAVLGDIFRTPEWLPIRRAFSAGDVLLGLGAFALVQRVMTEGRAELVRPSAGAR